MGNVFERIAEKAKERKDVREMEKRLRRQEFDNYRERERTNGKRIIEKIITRPPFTDYDIIAFEYNLVLENGEKTHRYTPLISLYSSDGQKLYLYCNSPSINKSYYCEYSPQEVAFALALIFPCMNEPANYDYEFWGWDSLGYKNLLLLGNEMVTKDELRLLSQEVLDCLYASCYEWKEEYAIQALEISRSKFDKWDQKISEFYPILEEMIDTENDEEDDDSEDEVKEAGNKGEKEVAYQLKWLPREYEVFNSVDKRILLKVDSAPEAQEIDHIVIGPNGVFMIETKNYSGTISIDRNGNWTRESREDTVGWKNPAEQIYRHMTVLNEIFKGVKVHPIICIANNGAIINGIENNKTPIIKSDMLLQYINDFSTEEHLSEQQIELFAEQIKKHLVE